MKKMISVLLIAVLTASALSACSLLFVPQAVPATEAATEAPAETTPATEAVTEALEPAVGTLGDYVATAKETVVSYGDGRTGTLRLPEILLDSADASAANAEIMDRFGDVVTGDANYTGAYALDYEAYLDGSILSVVILANYDGGNSYGLSCCFDVLTGARLDGESLCGALGRSYSDSLDALYANLAAYYEDRWGAIPGNDSMKEQTFDYSNLRAAGYYLDGDGVLTALVDTYAAVGGGHWVAQIPAE